MHLNLRTFKCIPIIAISSIIFFGCAPQKVVVANVNTANVACMYLDGTSFYNTYTNSSFILFGFKENGNNNYEITSNSVSGTNINGTLNLQSTGQTTPVTSNNDFSLLPSKISKKNVAKFIARLKSKDNIDFNTDYGQYYVNFKPQGIGGHGKNRYLRIGICLGKTTNGTCTSKAKLKSNPCPPCRNSYSSY